MLLRAATVADPAFFPAHHDYQSLMRATGRRAQLEREYPLPGRDALSACLGVLARAPSSYGALIATDLLAARRQFGAHPCFDAGLMGTAPFHSPGADIHALELSYASAATTYAPQVSWSWILHATALRAAGREKDALALLDSGLRTMSHPMLTLPLYMEIAALHEALGDSATATRIRLAVRAAVRRDRRPGLELAWLGHVGEHPPPGETRDDGLRRSRREVALARQHGAWIFEYSLLVGRGSVTLDAGRTNDAIAAFDSALTAIPSDRRRELAPQIHWRRGRAYSKAGRLADAERDLRQALVYLEGRNEVYNIAEVHHNLAHVYEGAGRWPEAIRAADQFVESSEPMRTDPMRMMSRRDAGIIRWKAGLHAAARASFESMVRVVDERKRNDYYAGEYFERVGQLQRALDYYRLGVRSDIGERSLNLAGLTRAYEWLGMGDSARAAATLHDEFIQTPTEMPMLPGVLAREGRVEEALERGRVWYSRQLGAGNVAGATAISLEVARILLDAGRPEEALTESARSDRLAGSLHLTAERIEALRIRGRAEAATGRPTALETLRRAASLARAHPSAQTTIATQLALGDVFAAAGRWRDALGAYSVAAISTDAVSESFEQDLDRARSRGRHLAAYDGALRVLLPRAHEASLTDSLLAWSARRKAAALAGATQPSRSSFRVTGAAIRATLSAEEALLDYLVVDGDLWVLVARRTASRLVRLPLSADSVAKLVARLRDPMLATFGGRLDLARARFSLATSHELYRALVAPAESELRGISRLIIVPEGAINYVPFDALVTAATGQRDDDSGYLDASFLVDRFAITIAPSAARAADARGGTRAFGNAVLVVTRRAAGGAKEADAVRSGWRGDVSVLSEGAATEQAVWTQAPRYAILHFATHAEANDRDPLASHLALAGGDAGDGLMHSAEIAHEKWRGRLVVLSGCETASGPLFGGEGMMGLARGFLVGGADAVVATLWPIGASSAEMMEPLYESLSRGAPTAIALRDAKLALRRNRATAHPFYWASYLLISARGRAG